MGSRVVVVVVGGGVGEGAAEGIVVVGRAESRFSAGKTMLELVLEAVSVNVVMKENGLTVTTVMTGSVGAVNDESGIGKFGPIVVLESADNIDERSDEGRVLPAADIVVYPGDASTASVVAALILPSPYAARSPGCASGGPDMGQAVDIGCIA